MKLCDRSILELFRDALADVDDHDSDIIRFASFRLSKINLKTLIGAVGGLLYQFPERLREGTWYHSSNPIDPLPPVPITKFAQLYALGVGTGLLTVTKVAGGFTITMHLEKLKETPGRTLH